MEASAGGAQTAHYELKYAHESEGGALEPIPVRAEPADRHEACLRYFPERFRGGDVLELAAGSGRLALSLAAAGVPFASYTASERSEARLAGLRSRFADPRMRVAQLDAEDLPLDDAPRYDAVFMIALVEHLVDPIAALTRVRALLRPGGFLYIDTPNIAKYTRRLKLLFGHFPATATFAEGLVTYDGRPADLFDEGHFHYFTYRSLSRMLVERCGFARVERRAYFSGASRLGRSLDHRLARLWPELFSDVCLIADV